MTIPTLVQSYQKQATATKWQKAYKTVNDAIALSQIENDSLTYWDYSQAPSETTLTSFAETYFVPYLKIIKNCKTQAGCFAEGKYKWLSGDDWYTLNSTNTSYKMILSDGSSIRIYYQQNCINNKKFCVVIDVDIDGPLKGESTYGYDFFTFIGFPFTNQIRPQGVYDHSLPFDDTTKSWTRSLKEDIYTNCQKGCEGKCGNSCGARILYDGNAIKYW